MPRAIKQGLLVVLVCAPFAFSGLFLTSLHDPEQGMYADIAATMAKGGDWVTPRFNGVAYFNKPPLVFWLTALGMLVFGASDWVARLTSAVPVLLVALLIWHLGQRLYGRDAGVLAAIVFATNIAILLYARVPSTDFLLILWLTLAIFAFVETVLDPNKSWCATLFWGSAGLGVLTKGLIGVLLPAMILCVYGLALLVWRRAPIEGRRQAIAGLRTLVVGRMAFAGWLLFALLVVPWHVLAEIRHPGFLAYYVMDHQLGRFFGTRVFIEDDVSSSTVSFLVVSVLLFFPWSIFLPASLRTGFPRLEERDSVQKCLHLMVGVWALSILVFFSLSASKLEHYGFPAFPALSLMAGALWSEALWSGSPPNGLKWSLVFAAVAMAFGGVMLLTLGARVGPRGWFAGLAEIDVYYRILKDQGDSFPFPSVAPFVQFARGLGVVLLVGFPLALLAFLARRPRLSFACIVVSVALIFVLGYRLAPVFELQQSAKPVSLALLERLEPGDRIVHEGELEYSAGLPFYTGRRVLVLNGRHGILEFGSRYPEADSVFVNTEQFVSMWEGPGRVFLVTRFSPQKSAIQRLPKEEVRLLGRFGSKWLYSNQTTHTDH